MRAIAQGLLIGLVCAALAACAYNHAPLVANPDGTVDSTHGPNGAQTSPR